MTKHYTEFYNHTSQSSTLRFSTVDSNAVLNCLNSIKSNASGSDGLSLCMLHLCSPYIVDYLTNIINSCLISSTFPSQWKAAIVNPVAKIEEPTSYKDIRPISLLPIMSKVFEKIVYDQLLKYLEANNILPSIQSGFRSNHSCMTALTKVTDDILQSYDSNMYSLLVLLDYSRAFDTVRHDILLFILKFIGLSPESVALLSDYLSGRTQIVKLRDHTSRPLEIKTGVPQGSILAPLLFAIYTHYFPKVLKFCNIHMYADDTQIYYSFHKKM